MEQPCDISIDLSESSSSLSVTMSSPRSIPIRPGADGGDHGLCSPQVASPGRLHGFLIPSPIPHRRNRTYSESERAAAGPVFQGIVKTFCREKGHGFIIPADKSTPLFMHISDIDGDFVPKTGDEVSYKLCHIPPKMEKVQAVHVTILKPAAGVEHETWDKKSEPALNTPSPK